MEKQIAVVICNYNGGEYVIRCIRSILASGRDDVDIIVVDNASEDGSPDLIRSQFNDAVMIIQNSENLGGAGGFGTGFCYALDKGYPYIMAMDNDAYIAEDTLTLLYDYLEEHPDVGMAAPKVLSIENPDTLIDYEGYLNFELGGIMMPWLNKKDYENAELVRDRGFAPTTAALMRRDALAASGGMDPEYFIYLDDIEMTHRMRLEGFRLVSLGKAKAWHKSGLSQAGKQSTFKTYYFERNRLYFFSKYVPEEKIDVLIHTVLTDLYRRSCIARKKGRGAEADTIMYALEDFLNGIRGKALEGRIVTFSCPEDKEIPPVEEDDGYEAGKTAFLEKYYDRFLEELKKINPFYDASRHHAVRGEIGKGLFKWYPFKNGSKILNICDAKELAEGSFDKDGAVFDYVVCHVPFEKMPDPLSVLSKLQNCLKDDGVCLFTADNRFGVRYLCGERKPEGKELLSKADITGIIDAGGFTRSRFYAVYPNADHPFYICAEDYIPKEVVRSRIFPFYRSPGTVYMDEMALYQQLVDNGMFVTLGNSFIVECSKADVLSDVCQVTGSYDRGKRDAFMTVIHGSGQVIKKPVYKEGMDKLTVLNKHAQELEEKGIPVASGKVEDGRYIMPFLEGESGHLYLRNLLIEDQEKFKEELDVFCRMIYSSSEIVTGSYQDLILETELLKTAYLDMVPLNTIYRDGQFVFFDQEFVQEAYPVKAVIYRVIHSLYGGNPELEKYLPSMELYQKYGLADDLGMWQKLEKQFLSELRNNFFLDYYWRQHTANPETIAANQRRMSYPAQDYRRFFEDMFYDLGNKKIVLFGSGRFAKAFMTRFGKNYPVIAAVDNSEDKWGSYLFAEGYDAEAKELLKESGDLSDEELRRLHGIRVKSPSYISELPRGEFKVIICIKNYGPILEQLNSMGIKEYSIYDPALDYIRTLHPTEDDNKAEQGEKKQYHIGYTAGAFDLFHTGHVNLLRRSKEMCDYLIVGVLSDEAIRNFKKKEPCIPYEDRAAVVAACKYVDEVVEVPYMRGNSDDAWIMYHFDVQFCGSDYVGNEGRMGEKRYLEEHGATLVMFPYTEHTSSSKIREKLQSPKQ